MLELDGARSQTELPSRSFLVHDLVHWCVEAEARAERGFWGLLAQGVPLASLADRDAPPPGLAELAVIEAVVGPLQTHLNGRAGPDFADEFERRGLAPWATAGFVHAVERRFCEVHGAWKATPFRGSLHLTWPPGPPRVTP